MKAAFEERGGSMKKFLLMVMILAVILGGAYFGYQALTENYNPTVTAGKGNDSNTQMAKDFSVKNSDGEQVNLSDFFGKPIILNFWATWCGPCQAEMPDFDEAFLEYGEDIEFVMVNQTDGSRDTVERAAAFIEEAGYHFPIYFDTTMDAAVAYHVTSIPRTIFIKADGTVLEQYKGMMSGEVLEEYIDLLLEES